MFAFLGFLKVYAQTAYDARIEKLASEIVAVFGTKEKIKIGLGSFTYFEKQTKLTRLIYDDLSSELVLLSNDKSKIIVSSEAKLNAVLGFMLSETETDKALLLGKEKAAEYVCFGRISDYESGYKIQIKLYETKEGNLVSAFKTTIDKSESLDNLNAQVIGYKQEELATVKHVVVDEPVKPQKEKKQREGKFWKFLGETALSTGTQILNNTLEKKYSGTGTPSETGNNSGGTDSLPGTQTSSGTDCKAYVNLANKTENAIVLKIYGENPDGNRQAKALYSYTIAAGKSKKLRIDKDTEYFFWAHNSTGATVFVGYREYEGRFEAEECGETVEEEIE